MEANRVLAIAVATGRVGYVFLVDKKLYGWSLSRKAASSAEQAARFANEWIDRMRPNVVVYEKITDRWRKGDAVRAAIEAIARVAEVEPLFDIAVQRPKRYANKFEEAEALANRFGCLARCVCVLLEPIAGQGPLRRQLRCRPG